MPDLVQQHLSDIIALFALLASLNANRIAEKARRSGERAEERNKIILKAEKRTEHLVEIELKNAAIGNVLFVTARKLFLFHEHPHLAVKYSREYERLSTNLNLMQELRAKSNYQRQVAEESLEEENVALLEEALADVRRLRVSLENEAQKEAQMLDELLQELKDGGRLG